MAVRTYQSATVSSVAATTSVVTEVCALVIGQSAQEKTTWAISAESR